MENLQYPIGRFSFDPEQFQIDFELKIKEIESLPQQMEDVVKGLPQEVLDTPYRPGGWTIRQVVHHVADSHAQCLTRFKWALTEDSPVIKAYYENLWAALPDSQKGPVEPAFLMLHGIHARWCYLLKQMSADDWNKSFFHPEKNRLIGLKETLFLYAWHGKHHLMHIVNLRLRMQESKD